MPLYDFRCDVCNWPVEVLVPMADRNKSIPHKDASEVECEGVLYRDGITGTNIGGMGAVKLDGRHQTKAIVYQGDRKVGHIPGHFGKSARLNKGRK